MTITHLFKQQIIKPSKFVIQSCFPKPLTPRPGPSSSPTQYWPSWFYFSFATSSVHLDSYFSIASAQQKPNPELILKPTFVSALFKWLSTTEQKNNNNHNYTEFVLLQITHQSSILLILSWFSLQSLQTLFQTFTILLSPLFNPTLLHSQ